MNRKLFAAGACIAAVFSLAVVPRSFGQAAPAPTPAGTTGETPEEVVKLSPFVVEATSEHNSYRADSTLAGTRVRTELKDIASSISVVTAQFLRDTGATNNQTLLQYTTNTEVGGLYGNYAGVGSTFINGLRETSNFLRPNTNTRVRGLDSADNTRDYFLTDIPWDSYIVDRVDLQRGPNSILFGIGSPAGIINTSVNMATFKEAYKLENRFGSFGTDRFSLDFNHVFLEQELAVRVAALDDDTIYRQKPAFNHDKRIFGALRWDPKLFKDSSAHTSLRANFEHGDVKANRPRVLPPEDHITPFFSTELNKQTFDPFFAWQAGIVPYSSSTTAPGVSKNFWLVQYMGPGLQTAANPMFIYNGANVASPSYTMQAGPQTYWGIASNGTRDSGIDGFPYASNIGIGSYYDFAFDTWRVNNATTQFPAADKGFYKAKVISDTSIFDFYNNLIDGPNKKEWQGWNAFNLSLEQTFLDNRLGFQVVYDHQKYNDGQERNLDSAYISVDIRKNLLVYPGQYTTDNGYSAPYLAVPNPYAGYAYVGSNTKNQGNSGNFSDRENFRATAFGEIRADDFLQKSWLTTLLGRHVLTGLYSTENYNNLNRNWVRYAVDSSYSDAIGNGGYSVDPYNTNPNVGNKSGGLANGDVVLDWITYLSGPLFSKSSASGLNLGRITATQSPQGTYTIPYYNSHWNAPASVDPAAAWLNPARGLTNTPVGEPTTQSENPLHYIGWTNGTFNVLNADAGDINQLYTDVSKVEKKTTSKAFTWQGYLWDDTIVGTVGWRRDRQEQRSGASVATGVTPAIPYPIVGPLDPATGVATGNSKSWGLVVHTPKPLRDKLPLGINLSLTYSDGRNTRVENRYGFDGSVLPNAKGETKDYGFVISALDDRVQFKATWYKTIVRDANLSSTVTEVSTLGSNTYYLRNLEAWGTASALLDLAGRAGGASGWEWYWDWALVDNGWDGSYNDPNGAAFRNSPSTIHQTAVINSWLSQMLPQSWFNAYGFPINVAQAKAGDWQHAIAGWTPYSGVGGLQPSGGGRINGSWPTGTVDNQSKGVEFELTAQPLKGWNVTINASKQTAQQIALGSSMVSFIEAAERKYHTDAGDLRLWWGGDQTVRAYFDQNIWSAYQFQLQTNGKMVPEMSPWRFNLVTNYTFDRGLLKGVNVGGGYRWQKGVIIGYALNTLKTNLDVNKPFWGKPQDAIDLWVGYERKLTNKINWRIQVNVRNFAQSPHLVPISAEPDGSTAAARIEDGQNWTLTNTFSF